MHRAHAFYNPHLYGPTEAFVHMPWHTQRIAMTESHLRTEQILMKFVGKEFDLFVILIDFRLEERLKERIRYVYKLNAIFHSPLDSFSSCSLPNSVLPR